MRTKLLKIVFLAVLIEPFSFKLYNFSNSDTVDWLEKIADTVIERNPDPGSYEWNWGEGVLMYGMWKAYESTGKTEYYNYVKSYIDSYVDEDGTVTAHIDNTWYVNRVSPAIILPYLYNKTKDKKYLSAADTIIDYLINSCPRTSDGAFVHVNDDELWVDTLYMATIFLALMGELKNDYTMLNEAVNQILLHANHLLDLEEKLYYHGWDENGDRTWADPVTHRSPCLWSRGNGWALLAILEVIECLPQGFPKKQLLISMVQDQIKRIVYYQDNETGMWYTIIDKKGHYRNYLESSSSAMFVYGIRRAIERGYISNEYMTVADNGNNGLNTKIKLDKNNLAVISGSSCGTGVADYNYYVNVHTEDNLPWGIAAFLMMKTYYRPNNNKPSAVSDFRSYRSGDSLSLTWSAVTTDTCGNPIEIDHYTIHKSIDVRFDPLTTETIGPIRETSYTDNSPGVVGDPSVNYFYRIVAVKENGQTSKPSNITGEFDYNLITTPSTDFNEIALPIMPENISTADDLMNFIPGCNSVARWNAQIQGYEQYIPELSFTNFDVKPGYPYYVNVTQNVVVTLTGEVKTPSFDLVTTPTTDFNEIMLTLDKANILTASSLMSDIPGCNSVARWNAQIQGYEQYIPELPFTNFNVKPGYPYYVNVTQNATWPDGDGSQKRVLGSTVLSATSKTPHLVWGRVRTDVDIGGFTSYINSHDSDILSHVSPGCFLRDGYWAVQCGNFNSHWIPGDVLTVEFENKEGIRISTAKITLSDNGYDEIVDLIHKKKIIRIH